MIFEVTGTGSILCRLTLEEAERARNEGYLTIVPEEDGALCWAIREEVKGQAEVPEEIRPALDAWLAYKREKRQTYKPRGLKALIAQMAQMGPERAEAAVQYSMAHNYAGLFEPKTDRSARATDMPPKWAIPIMTTGELEAWPHWDRNARECFLGNLNADAARRRRVRGLE